jgi:hypothetical protein
VRITKDWQNISSTKWRRILLRHGDRVLGLLRWLAAFVTYAIGCPWASTCTFRKLRLWGDPITTGRDEDWLLLRFGCPCGEAYDYWLAAKDIWVLPCWVLPCCWGRFLRVNKDEARDEERTWEVVILTELFHWGEWAGLLLLWTRFWGNSVNALGNLVAINDDDDEIWSE